MKLHLEKLEDNLKKLRLDLEARQSSHQTAVLDKQEVLHHEVNKMSSKQVRNDLSPRRRDDIESGRKNYSHLKSQKVETSNMLKDLKRQVPSLAADFMYELTKQQGNINILIDQTSDLKGDIICLEEEKKSLKLIAKLEDEKIKIKE